MNEKFFALSNRPQSHEAFNEAKTRMLKVVKFTVRLEWMTYLRSDEQKIHYYFSEKNRVLLRQQRQRLWQRRRPIFFCDKKNRVSKYLFVKLPIWFQITVWKKFFREINYYFVTSVKNCFHEIFVKWEWTSRFSPRLKIFRENNFQCKTC